MSDVLIERTIARLTAARGWGERHGVKVVVGEFGVPVHRDARWYALARAVYAEAGRRGIPVQWWAAIVWGNPGYHLAAWDSQPPEWGDLDARLGAAVAVLRAGSGFGGVNVCGGEFGWNDWDRGANKHYSGAHPGTVGLDYWYPTLAQWRALRRWGIRTCRLPFAWERLQRSKNADLDAGELTLLRACIGAARMAGVRVVPVLWGHGAYIERDGEGIIRRWPSLDQRAWIADLWMRLARALKAESNIAAWDLLNEPAVPGGMDGDRWIGGEAAWARLGAEAVTAIRATGDRRPIWMPSGNYSQAGMLPQAHPDGPWWLDPLGRTLLTVHLYADSNADGVRLGNGNGKYSLSYDEELARAAVEEVG